MLIKLFIFIIKHTYDYIIYLTPTIVNESYITTTTIFVTIIIIVDPQCFNNKLYKNYNCIYNAFLYYVCDIYITHASKKVKTRNKRNLDILFYTMCNLYNCNKKN